jgi:hypothetical protein
MAGYFYNDARVRPVRGADEIFTAAQAGPALVLCGPGERQRLAGIRGLRLAPLARGPRDNVLLEVSRADRP